VNVCRFVDGFDMQLKSLVMGNPKFRGYLNSRF